MSIERVSKLLKQKEGIRLEFKESHTELPKNLFETICAMLNREGGDILLGVSDNGTVKGIDSLKIESIKHDLVSLSNNANKIEPPFILFPKTYTIEKQTIIHIQVPASSQLHRSASVVFDRSHDGDFKVTRLQNIAEIYNNKRTHYTEAIVYPWLRYEDFKAELFPKIRNLIKSNSPLHPWLSVDDETMLKMAGLSSSTVNIPMLIQLPLSSAKIGLKQKMPIIHMAKALSIPTTLLLFPKIQQ